MIKKWNKSLLGAFVAFLLIMQLVAQPGYADGSASADGESPSSQTQRGAISPLTLNDRVIVGNLIYKEINPTSVQLIGYTLAAPTNVTVPDKITLPGGREYTVTSIGDDAFWNCTSLSSITLPDTVTSIGAYAFAQSGLSSITIPDKVTSIGDYAFAWSPLSNITIPDTVTTIGDFAFIFTSLSSITLPASLTTIENGTFSGCPALSTVIIPNTVTSIGDSAFDSCISLGSITLPKTLTSIGSNAFDGCISLASITLPSSVTSIGNNAFGFENYNINVSTQAVVDLVVASNAFFARIYLNGTAISLPSLPSPATTFFDGLFRYEVITGTDNVILISGSGATGPVTLPSTAIDTLSSPSKTYTVTGIGYGAFFSTGLTSITIPDTVTSIGTSAFANCTLLASVNLPASLTSIGNSAFSGTGLTSITIPASVTTIGNLAFDGCYSLTTAHIKGILTYIGNEAFLAATLITCDHPETQMLVAAKLHMDTLPVSKWDGTRDIPAGAVVTIDTDMTVSGNVTIGERAEITVKAPATLNIASGGTVKLEEGVKITVDSGASISGQGAIGVVGNVTINNRSAVTVAFVDAPSKPRNVDAAAGDTKIDLNWDAPANAVAGQPMKYKISLDGVNWITTTHKTATIAGLTNGQSYTFYIKAVNFMGESDTVTVTATPKAPAVIPPVTPPTGGKIVGGNNVYDYSDFNPAYTDSSSIYSGSSSTTYKTKTLTDTKTGVSVKGSFTPNAQLVVEKTVNSNAIVQFDISINGGYSGKIEVSIPVGEKYKGKTVVVTHQMKSGTETFNPTVQNGYVTINVSSFSPFIVTESGNSTIKYDSSNEKDSFYNPNTGGELPQCTNNNWVYGLVLMSISFAMIFFGIRKRLVK